MSLHARQAARARTTAILRPLGTAAHDPTRAGAGGAHRLRPYLVALGCVALVTLARLPLEGWLEGRAPYALYFLAILCVAWSEGVRPTVFATALALLAAKFFFVPVRWSLAVAPGEEASLALFVLSSSAMIVLSRRAARLRADAQRNEAACRRAERSSRSAVWDWDEEDDAFDSVALAELFGLEPRSGKIAASRLEALVLPEDRARFRDGLLPGSGAGEPRRVEFRVQHPTKGLRWLATVGERSGARVSGLTIDVTERMQAERAAAEQREWFEVTLRSIGDAVIASDRDGRVSFMNPVAESLTGWKADEALGRPLDEVFDIVNERTREPADNPAHKVMRSGVIIGLANHTALIARDGSERPIADSAAPILDKDGAIQGVILVFHDMTAEREAADAIAEQREWFQRTLESIGDAVIASDVRGRVVFMNPVAEFLTGRKQDEARGLDCAEVFQIVNEQTRTTVESPVGRVLREGTVVGLANHTVLIASNGVERPIDDSGAPIRSRDGRIVGVVLVFRDVTEQRALENERRLASFERERLLASERAARSDAERANRLKDEFVATLSHELRTPLNAIQGWVHVLRASAPDEATLRQGLDVIDRNTRLQAQLVSDLLDMSSILSGKLRLDVRSTDAAQIVEAALETVRSSFEAKGIAVAQEIEPLPPVVVDPARLQQVLWNLLSNAAKFTGENGRVTIAVRRRDEHAEIAVTDDGVGIRPEFLRQVFDRFRQGDGSTTRRYGGLGLGLAVVKQLVELQGGSVQAESEGEGKGATFRVRLPIGGRPERPAGAQAGKDDCERIAELSAERLRKLRILVVEDEQDTRELVVRLLEECGAVVEGVSSATAALQHLAREAADVLICDIGMPGMDGYSLIQHIRRMPDPRVARIPAIALTAFARPEDRTHALRSGYQAHLVKPMEPSELIATVASFAGLLSQDAPRGGRG